MSHSSYYYYEFEKMKTYVESGAGHAVYLCLSTDWAANQLSIQNFLEVVS